MRTEPSLGHNTPSDPHDRTAALEAQLLTAVLARRYVAQTVPGHEARFEYTGTLSVRGGLPMTLGARRA